MGYRGRVGFIAQVPPAVRSLIIANAAVFLITLFFRSLVSPVFGLVPAYVWRGFFWQPFTYMFLHGGVFHLLFNMLVLWMFGAPLETTWGSRRFLIFYFICGVGAGLLNVVVTPLSHIPIVGSSGAVYGLLMAFAILFPEQLIYFWGIFPIKAKYFVIGIGAIEFITAVSASESGVAHVAHLGGMLFGLVYLKWHDWRNTLAGRRIERRRERHLKVVWDREKERQRLQAEIDALLDKAGKNGIESLSAEDHEAFSRASRKLQELERRE